MITPVCRSVLRRRLAQAFTAGRCVLLGARGSAGPYHRAVEGDGWALLDGGRVDLCDTALDLAAQVLQRHDEATILAGLTWCWREEHEAAAWERDQRAARAVLDAIPPVAVRQQARLTERQVRR